MSLTEWQKEDIEDLLEEYPELAEMTDEELDDFSRKSSISSFCHSVKFILQTPSEQQYA